MRIGNVGAAGAVTRTECFTFGGATASTRRVVIPAGGSGRVTVGLASGGTATCVVSGLGLDGRTESNVSNNRFRGGR